ncbi:MAG: 30S ribosomal protein S5 [Planctomycetaceae bacterium]|nr:30S ribosomal protein S5 [Planctomycetaceae bacterium]
MAVEQRKEQRKDGQEKVIQIRRCACVVKGGRRFTFTALVVLGDKHGRVGWGYGKASEVPLAVEKAVKGTNRNTVAVPLAETTIPHQVEGRYGAARVVLIPALPGTGVIAGNTVRAVLESAGVHDVLTKSRGSNNPMNLVRATIDALTKLRTRDQVARLRGVALQ